MAKRSETVDFETGIDSCASPKETVISRESPTHRTDKPDLVMEFGASRVSVPETQQSIYKERSRRAATIEVSETCDLLCISRKNYQEILLHMMQRELDHKLKALLTLPFFAVKIWRVLLSELFM